MLLLDRKKFWDGYHKAFDAHGPTTQKTVDALNYILDRFEDEPRIKFVSWAAYILATAYHESGINGNHFVPVKEGKARVGTKVWEKYQKKYWGTGFYGRGIIQTTHKENYLKLGQRLGVGDMFVNNPDLLLELKWSYESIVLGMTEGIYRSDSKGRKNLARYLKSDDASVSQYVQARDIVNGDVAKNGLMIANYAEKFEHIIFNSQVSAADPSSATSGSDSASNPALQTPQTSAADSSHTGEIKAENVQINQDTASVAPPPTFVAETKEMEAPPKDGATAGATKTTILGIAVPAGVYAVFKGIQEWIEKGFIDVKEVLSALLDLIRNNVRYVAILAGFIIGVMMLKKVFKQATFLLQMYLAARPDMHNIVVKPAEPEAKTPWWRFW